MGRWSSNFGTHFFPGLSSPGSLSTPVELPYVASFQCDSPIQRTRDPEVGERIYWCWRYSDNWYNLSPLVRPPFWRYFFFTPLMLLLNTHLSGSRLKKHHCNALHNNDGGNKKWNEIYVIVIATEIIVPKCSRNISFFSSLWNSAGAHRGSMNMMCETWRLLVDHRGGLTTARVNQRYLYLPAFLHVIQSGLGSDCRFQVSHSNSCAYIFIFTEESSPQQKVKKIRFI